MRTKKEVADELMMVIGVKVRCMMVIKMMITVAIDGENGDSSEDKVIVIDSEVEDEKAEYEISAINVTLQRTTKLVDGALFSVKRSVSWGILRM